MLSFFSKKKNNVKTLAEDIIQRPVQLEETKADDFIFIERKNKLDDTSTDKPSTAIYPPLPMPYPLAPYPLVSNRVPSANNSIHMAMSTPYIQGVPFILSPYLTDQKSFVNTQLEVDELLALLTRQMSVYEEDEYNFSLERSIQNN